MEIDLKDVEEQFNKWDQKLREIDEELNRLTTYRAQIEQLLEGFRQLLEGYRKLNRLMHAASSQAIPPMSSPPKAPYAGTQGAGTASSPPLTTLDELIEEVLRRTGRTVITPIEIVRTAMQEGLWHWSSEKSALNSITKALRNRVEAYPERYQLVKKSNNRLYFIVKSKEDEKAQHSSSQDLLRNTDTGGEKEMQGHGI